MTMLKFRMEKFSYNSIYRYIMSDVCVSLKSLEETVVSAASMYVHQDIWLAAVEQELNSHLYLLVSSWFPLQGL